MSLRVAIASAMSLSYCTVALYDLKGRISTENLNLYKIVLIICTVGKKPELRPKYAISSVVLVKSVENKKITVANIAR